MAQPSSVLFEVSSIHTVDNGAGTATLEIVVRVTDDGTRTSASTTLRARLCIVVGSIHGIRIKTCFSTNFRIDATLTPSILAPDADSYELQVCINTAGRRLCETHEVNREYFLELLESDEDLTVIHAVPIAESDAVAVLDSMTKPTAN